ncbi:putative tail protein [Leptospira phage LE3]|uniref:Putative tail protein n=2 Tax=Nylescharonvirus TaxID=2843431 RepID=A0A343LEE7_9CAUD|nr:putative tail protein [Leptospira phage LE3]YP_009835519.1 putative tail protein [Leptospira phage LE4]ATN94948.1 putative tail protein [Leptospira phage LE3]ATN95057.1 putative tail protein [Leptospira phage LE4]
MKAYQTDVLGYYIGEVSCQPNPLEKGKFLIPMGAITAEPPNPEDNKIAFWNGERWQLVDDYSKEIYYSVHDSLETKIFPKGEKPGNDFTNVPPIKGERFQKFEKNEWVIDSKEKTKRENEIKVLEAKDLLFRSDWTQTLDVQKKKGQKWVDSWAEYREELRAIIQNPNNSKEFPKEPSGT